MNLTATDESTAVTTPGSTGPATHPMATDPLTRRLRRVLLANAATSLLTGLAGLIAAPWWADRLGLGSVGWTRAVAAGLVLFAFDVGVLALRGRPDALRAGALLVSMADLAWVAATVVALATVDLTTTGQVVAVVVGVGVLDFALLQLWYRRALA